MLNFNYISLVILDADFDSLFVAVCFKFSFIYIICSEAGYPLRDELSKSPQKILASAFSEFLPKSEVVMASSSTSTHTTLSGEEIHVSASTDAPNVLVPTPNATSDAYFQGLALIKTLVKLMPGWLQSNRTVFDTLVLVWKSPARISRLQNEQELNLMQVSIGKDQFSYCSIIIVDFRCMTKSSSWICRLKKVNGLSNAS